MAGLNLSNSENFRDALSREQEQQIRAMYGRLANEARQQADALRDADDGTPNALQRARLEQFADQLKTAHDDMTAKIESNITSNMQAAAQAVINDNKNWLSSEGMKVQGAYTNVPQDVVNAIISGKVYQPLADGSSWQLSTAIWHDAANVRSEIDRIIAQGVAANKSTYEIAKDLEAYVDPSAAKAWDWGKVYPGTRKQIDYNAQRLARTLVSHAYQTAFVTATKHNPFVSGYVWHVGNSHRVCPICDELDGQFFSKDDLPMDHPNGMCYFEAVVPDMNDVADRIADWYNGKSDPGMDNFADHLFGSSWRDVNDTANDLKNTSQQ